MLNKILQIRRRLKRFIYTKLALRRVKKVVGPVYANGKTTLTGTTELGANVHFNGLVASGGGKLKIGNNFHSGEGCMIITQIHNYDHGTAIPYDTTYIHKDVIIEDNVWLGSRVIILGGVTIGEGAIIQAGSCVVKDIPKYAIAGGHPARVFSQRNIEHYELLKAEGKYQ